MLVCCVGDVMLDVVVDAPAGLVADDDTPAGIVLAAGGQAANVAAWVSALGGRARVFGPRSREGAGRLVAEHLAAAGVELHGPETSHPGVVMSLVTQGTRSLASDPGSLDWLSGISPGDWLDGADWVFVSGYALLRCPEPELLVEVAAAARAEGARVAVDLSSASMIRGYGAARFRRLWQSLEPAAIFANDEEWAATNAEDEEPAAGAWDPVGSGGTSVLVLKHGSGGASFVIDGVEDRHRASPGPVVDATGSGDALTAGYLLGGVEPAMAAAARCVAQVGAQPRVADRDPGKAP